MAKEAKEPAADDEAAAEPAPEAKEATAADGGKGAEKKTSSGRSNGRRRRAPWHVSVARALGLASGWAAGGIDRASKMGPRRRTNPLPLIQSLGALMSQHSGDDYAKVRQNPEFWKLVGALARNRPRPQRRPQSVAKKPAAAAKKPSPEATPAAKAEAPAATSEE